LIVHLKWDQGFFLKNPLMLSITVDSRIHPDRLKIHDFLLGRGGFLYHPDSEKIRQLI